MSWRGILLVVAGLFALAVGFEQVKRTTPTEAQALREAAQNRTAYTLPPEKLRQAQALFRTRTTLHFVGEGWGILQVILLLAAGAPAWMRDVAERLTTRRWGQSLIFVFLFLLAITVLNLPLRIYGHHTAVVYGLSVQGWGSWLWDQAKSFLLAWLVGSLLVMMLFWVIRRSPRRWWFWFWIPTMAAVLFGVFVSPIVVDPLFDKFEPLQQHNPALVEQLEKVVARSGVSLSPDRMFYMRASRKVTSLNAYVTGFGPSKRLVLWDTTIAASTPDELSGIFGHELGHYALHHVVLGLLFSAVGLLVGFRVGEWATQGLMARFGTGWRIRSQNDLAFLAVLVLVLRSGASSLSRSTMGSADRSNMLPMFMDRRPFTASSLIRKPRQSSGFQRLGEASLDDPTPHPLVEFWTFDHPSTADRAAFAAAYNPWKAGQHPKYFQP